MSEIFPLPSASGNLFLSYLAQKRPLVERWLEEHAWHAAGGKTSGAITPSAVTSPTLELSKDLSHFLYEPLKHYHLGAGKRVRPILVILGCEAFGGDESASLATGCSIEMFQSAALIHDDIADASDLRRGVAALHKSLGLGLAINVGDAALVEVVDTILADEHLDNTQKLGVLETIVEMERKTLEGQALDLGWVEDGRWDTSVEDYLFMAEHKTAYYSAASPLVLGALCAGADTLAQETLRSFGLKAGLAFQLRDDVLNLEGDAELQGKDFRSDITEAKRTMMVAYACEHLAAPQKEELIDIFEAHTQEPQKLERAVELMQNCGAIAATKSYANQLTQEALADLDLVELDNSTREILRAMANFFVERTS